MNHFVIDESCSRCSKRFNSLFCNTSNDVLQNIDQEKICTEYKKNDVIFREGTTPRGVYCLNRGKVKIVKKGEDGKYHILRLVAPGEPMGYRALLSEGQYQASAIALETSGICFIPKDLFIGILRKDANLSMEIMRKLTGDLQLAELHLTHLAQKPVRERLAEAILFIKESYGYKGDGSTIDAALSREDIASIVGTSRETVIRSLSDLKKEGIIDLVGKHIRVDNLQKLIQLSHLYD